MSEVLAAALRRLLPAGVAVGSADPRRMHPLWPGEDLEAAPGRRAEFSAGRSAARAAMKELGVPPRAIPARPDRAPLWPGNVVGSITHTRGAALAAVALSADLVSLGIDMEPQTAVTPELWQTICLPDELDLLIALPAGQAAGMATALFCAKEAAYKAQYPLTGELFDFHRLAVTFEGDGFTARFTARTGQFAKGAALAGRLGRAKGQILAAVAVQSQNMA
ncbi:MAG: 4'-phosphopantetheinyl transferase superfamily protein [Paracoccaceae bacterium]